jgi:2-polyprenyl-3-methyl-5-hydroxy-6-metoxy-1,4-benzoquinol methylase
MAFSQCQCGTPNMFGKRAAARRLKQYRRHGPDGTTKMLLDALAAEGVEGLSLLDIGGGVGTIALELLKSGVTSATEVDASPAYVTAARAQARERALTDRLQCREGDFVALAEDVPPAGIVTLDRVICCYPNMHALVGESAAKAERLYGAVYPRDIWLVRIARAMTNVGARLLRNPLRLYVHRTVDVDAVIRSHGLLPRFHRNAGFWQVTVYARSV